MTAEEIEQLNKYNAKHYEPFEENEDIEFYFEPECFEEWLENTDSKSVSTGSRSIITKTYAKNFYTRFIEDKI